MVEKSLLKRQVLNYFALQSFEISVDIVTKICLTHGITSSNSVQTSKTSDLWNPTPSHAIFLLSLALCPNPTSFFAIVELCKNYMLQPTSFCRLGRYYTEH